MRTLNRKPFASEPLFDSFVLAGFECSDHLLDSGKRLDMLAATRHDELAAADYARLRSLNITTCREGVSWVRCEPAPGQYDFSSLAQRLRASQGMQLIWDLMHFGWPDHVDVFAADFRTRFGAYAHALADHLARESSEPFMFTPINEMSFLAWAGGDTARLNPFVWGRGLELKVQLVAATLAAMQSIRRVLPNARFLQAEPLIHIVPDPTQPETWGGTRAESNAQYQALDMLAGKEWCLLGGSSRQLDVVGVNFYPDNQFTRERTTVWRGEAGYRPLSELLLETWEHFDRRPIVISETGAEDGDRAEWFRYVAEECVKALDQGCELHGVTLYPILNHPGWLNERHCHNGLWDYADETGERAIHEPLAAEVRAQMPRLIAARARMLQRHASSLRAQRLG